MTLDRSAEFGRNQATNRGDASDVSPIRTMYWQRLPNVGDRVAPYLLENITGRPAISTRSIDAPYILSIGSLLQTSTPEAFIWGTGLIHPSAGIGNPDPRRILAVRGKLSHGELLRAGVSIGDVPLGDPGILIPRFLADNKPATERFQLGLVPYVFDRDHPFFLEAAAHPEVRVLDVCAPVQTFLAELASCDAIASSSLHGLVFGEAMGLPTLWLEFSDKVGGRFKFDDWFSLAGNPQADPAHPTVFSSVTAIAAQCEPRHIEIDKGALISALATDAIESCSMSAGGLRTIIPVPACRARPLPLFLISLNDASALERAMAWSGTQSRQPIEPVIYDDGSDDPAALSLLGHVAQTGIKVYRRCAGEVTDKLDRINAVVRTFFEDWAEPSRYVVTECTTDISAIDRDAIALYDDLLNRFPRCDSAGPDLPSIPIGNAMDVSVNCRMPGAAPEAITDCRCRVVEMEWDHGFSLYRSGTPLTRSMKSLRVRAPQ
jgi:hypothetical protein